MNSGQIKIPGGADGSPEEKQASLPQRPSSTDTERPPSGQHEQPHMKAERSDDDEQDLDVDPAEKIALFDWQNLTQRYHDEMTKCQQNEEELMKEWEELMNVKCATSVSPIFHSLYLVLQNMGRGWPCTGNGSNLSSVSIA